MRPVSIAAAAVAGVLGLAGCASQGGTMASPDVPGQSGPPSQSSSAEPGGSPSASGRPPFQTASPLPTGIVTEVPTNRWQAILADLTQSGVTGDVTLVSAESVTFSDGSLGCPQKGRVYTQALVPGMKVVVRAGGATYDYRFGRSDAPRLCEQGK